MSRPRAASLPYAVLPPQEVADRSGVTSLDRMLYLTIACVLAARMLLSESFELVTLPFLRGAAAQAGPTPIATAMLDSLLAIAAGGGLLLRRTPQRAGPAWIGLPLLLAAVVLSTLRAGDSGAALSGGSSLLISAAAGVALARLMQVRWMVHLLIAALLAGALTTGVKCILQHTVEFEDARKAWLEQVAELKARGVDVAQPGLVDYGRRLESRAAFAYLPHPNLAASILAMCGVAAVGLLIAALHGRRADLLGGAAAVGVLLGIVAVGLWLTDSQGGQAAALAGAVAVVVLGSARRWVASRARTVVVALVAMYAAIVLIGVGWGVARGTLPHESLAFRWHYWTAAAKAFAAAPLTGVGRLNFRDAYLLHKPAESTEEVSDPHNVLVSLSAETGVVGLVAGCLLLFAALAHAVRGLAAAEQGGRAAPDAGAEEDALTRSGLGRLTAVALGVLGLQLFFSGTPLLAPGAAVVWIMDVALPWSLSFLVCAWLLDNLPARGGLSPWVQAGLLGAVIVQLLHSLVDFALTTPAGLGTFAALAACAAARFGPARAADSLIPKRTPVEQPPRDAVAADWMLRVAIIAQLLVVLPREVARTKALGEIDRRMSEATSPQIALADLVNWETVRSLKSSELPVALRFGYAALDLARQPGLSAAQVDRCLSLARSAAETALRRSPGSFNARRLRALVADATANAALVTTAHPSLDATGDQALDATGDAAPAAAAAMERRGDDGAVLLLREAAQHWERAVERYPTDPRAHIAAGRAWLRLWRVSGSAADAARVSAHMQEAQHIDATRPPDASARLSAAERAAIDEALRELVQPATRPRPESAATSAPATAPTTAPTSAPTSAPAPAPTSAPVSAPSSAPASAEPASAPKSAP